MSDLIKSSADYFDGISADYYSERYGDHGNVMTYGMTRRLEIVLKIVAARGRGKRLIDFGCGPAVAWEGMSAFGYEYYGTDISVSMILDGAARARANPEVRPPRLVVGNVIEPLFRDGAFDVAIGMGLTDYLPDETAFYRELYRVLATGGVAVVTFSNRFSWATLVRSVSKPILGFFAAKNSVLTSDIDARAFSAGREIKKLEAFGFRKLTTVYSGAHIIPFGVNLPRFYFSFLNILERIYGILRFRPGFSAFTIALEKI